MKVEEGSVMNPILRGLLLGVAWLACGLGIVGVFVPVLPTTPLLLLATFLFAKCSPRAHAWITGTKVYRTYVVPFKEAGGMPVGAKVRMLAISYAVLAVSALLVQKPLVWGILAAVALFLLWLAVFHIPTIEKAAIAPLGDELEVEA